MGRNPAPLTHHWTFWKVCWRSNAGSGKPSVFWLWHMRCQQYEDPPACLPGAVNMMMTSRGPLLTENQCQDFAFSGLGLTSDQIRSVAQSCPTLCDPMNCSTVSLRTSFLQDCGKLISCSLKKSFYETVLVVSSSLVTWPGRQRSKRQDHFWVAQSAEDCSQELWVNLSQRIPSLWIRERLPTPVFWPGELHGLYSPWVTHFTSFLLSDVFP